MSWIKLSSVTATSGQKAVVVNSGESLANVKQRDGLIIGIDQFVEIASTSVTADGKPVLMLQDNWPAATVTNQPAKVVPTAGDFVEAARMLREVSVFASSTFGGLNEFITSTNDTFTVVDALGNTKTIPTYHFYREKLTADTQTSIDKAAEATAAAQTATQKAIETSNNAATVANLKNEVVQKHGEVLSKATTVASQTATVNQKAAEVASNASTVASNTTTTTQKAAEATAAANTSTNNARLSKEWAVGLTPPAGNTAPSNTNNAMYWAQQAQHNANQTFISGGLFTPTTQTPYPNTTGVVRDTIWLVEFAAASTTFTYTSGQLSGKTVKNGDMIFWDTPENKFNLIPTKLGGILSLITEWGTEEGPSVDIRGRYTRKSGDIMTGGLRIDHGSAATPGLRVGGLTHKAAVGVSSTVGEVLYGVAQQGTDITAYLRIGHTLDSLKFSPDAITQYDVYHAGNKPNANDVGAVSKTGYSSIDGDLRIYNALRTLLLDSPFDSNGWPNATAGDDNSYPNRSKLKIRVGNNALHFIAEARENARRFGIQSGHEHSNYANAVGILDLNPFGGDVRVNGHKVYAANNKPTAADVGAVPATSKAAFIAAGPTTSRPTTSEFPTNTRALRFNTTTGEWEGLDPSGNITPIGGGGVPPFIEKTASFTVEKKKAYKLKMVDGVNKVVTVPNGFANDDWFVVSTLEWNRGLAGLTATVQFGTEVLTNGQEDFDGYVIDRPCVLYFLKSGGKWTLADGIGIDGSYNALENRVDELEKPSEYLFSGSSSSGGALSKSLRDYDFINITATATWQTKQYQFNVLIPSDSIVHSDSYTVISYLGSGSQTELLSLFISFPTNTSFSLVGGNGSGWTPAYVTRIKGVNRL